MKINLELYKVFYYTAKNMSFSEAAKQLFISQSAISQSIKSLETQLNTHLFIRNTKKVHLTKEGQLLLNHIEPAMNLIHNGEDQIHQTQQLNMGHLHIGASDTICKYYLLPIIHHFHTQYPNIKLQITNRTSIQCVDLLQNGTVDFIVTNLPNDSINDSMRVTKLKSFKDCFIAGPAYAHLKNKNLTLSELVHYPLLMLEKQTTTRQFLYTLFHSLGLSVSPEVELGSIDLLIQMAGIGLGISFVPDYCLDLESKIFKLHIMHSIPSRSLAITTKKNIPLSVAAQKFIAICKDRNMEK